MQVPHLPLQHVVGTCNGAGGLTPQWGGGGSPSPPAQYPLPLHARNAREHARGRTCVHGHAHPRVEGLRGCIDKHTHDTCRARSGTSTRTSTQIRACTRTRHAHVGT